MVIWWGNVEECWLIRNETVPADPYGFQTWRMPKTWRVRSQLILDDGADV